MKHLAKLYNRSLIKHVGACAALMIASQAHAVTIATDPSLTSMIPGLTGFTTDGAMMTDMSVRATFGSGLSESRLWASTGPTSGGVDGSIWSLSLPDDSFSTSWLFTNSSADPLVQLILDGSTGLTVFDRTDGNGFTGNGTTGSGSGRDFADNLASLGVATYSDQVAIGANPAVGDLWHILTVDFSQGVQGNFTFIQDTDNDSRFTTTVPEPMSLGLMAAGLLGLTISRRRKQLL